MRYHYRAPYAKQRRNGLWTPTWKQRIWQRVRCPRRTYDGYQCRFQRFHDGECEIGGELEMPSSLEERNATLRRWIQRGFECEVLGRHHD